MILKYASPAAILTLENLVIVQKINSCAALPRRYNSAQRRPALPLYFVSDGLSPAVGRFRCCVVCAYLTALKRLLGRHCILSVSV
jgi:hypothetical protein